MKKYYLLFVVALLISACTIMWYRSSPYQLVYLYDNLVTGLGDKMAQEKLVHEIARRGIKVETLSSKMDNSFVKFIQSLFKREKYFSIVQSFITSERANILAPGFWNYNTNFLTLLFASMDFSDNPTIKNNTELCKAYHKQSFNYKYGRKEIGFLVTSSKKINVNCDEKSVPFHFILTWYPTTTKTEFNATQPKHEKVFYALGGGWDMKRQSQKYIDFIKILGQGDYLDLYGPRTLGPYGEGSQETFKATYKGYMQTSEEIMRVSSEYAAILVLHSDTHTNYKIPSGRIFEAMASGRVIISDDNPWVKRTLGEAALYVDMKKGAKEIASQITNHVKWMRDNPAKAMELARKSHKIFIENFTLEEQVDHLLKRLES